MGSIPGKALSGGSITCNQAPKVGEMVTKATIVHAMCTWGCKWCWEGMRQTGFADECANKVVMQDNGRAREGPLGKGECFGQRQH